MDSNITQASPADVVIALVARHLGYPGKIEGTHRLREDLHGTAFERIELIIAIEDEFDIAILAGDLSEFKTVQDFIDYVSRVVA